ncbi:hypothetical protein QN277_018805 [Acacia crassicarpa]|uniref:Uncharacterized protein n=1 Tax=Acacia crassicarpa TaxID=499986 RepID=A0AAE1JUD5_9FABA|nr:hypothetical protein QN277_018805 [Acacia crassicarpa]
MGYGALMGFFFTPNRSASRVQAQVPNPSRLSLIPLLTRSITDFSVLTLLHSSPLRYSHFLSPHFKTLTILHSHFLSPHFKTLTLLHSHFATRRTRALHSHLSLDLLAVDRAVSHLVDLSDSVDLAISAPDPVDLAIFAPGSAYFGALLSFNGENTLFCMPMC